MLYHIIDLLAYLLTINFMKYLLVFFVIIFFGCNEHMDANIEDVKKAPEMIPFIISSKEFKGTHVLDTEELYFSYDAPGPTKRISDTLDYIAKTNGWKIVLSEEVKKIYSKKIVSFPADTANYDTLSIEIKTNNKLEFIYK